jgi:hypothetical protein
MLGPAVRPQAETEGRWMAGFLFKLELANGAPAVLTSTSD